MIRAVALALALAFGAVTVSGCAGIGTQQVAPQTHKQRMAYAIGTLTLAYNTLADLFQRGRVTREEAMQMVAQLEQAEQILAALIQSGEDNPEALQIALDILLAVEKRLQEKA